jgi:diguanylate cyclase (GGDEF)-like protein
VPQSGFWVINKVMPIDDLDKLKVSFDRLVHGDLRGFMTPEQRETLDAQMLGILKFAEQNPTQENLQIASTAMDAVQIALGVALKASKIAYYQLDRANSHKKDAQHYKALADTDPLTKLPSRRSFSLQIAQALKLNETEVDPINSPNVKRYFGLMLMDLDRFKDVNETAAIGGHAAGDQALKAFGEHLLFHTRREADLDDVRGTVARLGGDEFTMIIEVKAESRQEASDYLILAQDKIRERFKGLHTTFKKDSVTHTIPIVVSTGLHIFDEEDTELNAYQGADSALNEAKHRDPAQKARRYEDAVEELKQMGLPNIFVARDLRGMGKDKPASGHEPPALDTPS